MTKDYGNGLVVEYTDEESARLTAVLEARALRRLTGIMFGDWEVLWRANDRGRGSSEGLSPFVLARCKCGRIVEHRLETLKRGSQRCYFCEQERRRQVGRT